MKSIHEIKASAVKLRDLLSAQNIELKHSESLEVISKLEGFPDWNTHIAYINKREKIAEEYLSEMLVGHMEMDYEKITKHMDEDESEDYTKKEFMRTHTDLHEDLGPFVSRNHLGAISGESTTEPDEEYPGGIRHVWRGVFEKHEVFIHVGIFLKDGTYTVAEAKFR